MEYHSHFESLLQLNETSEVFPLWPSTLISENATAIVQHRDLNDHTSNRLISGVSCPEIMVYTPQQSNGIGIVVFPRGELSENLH